MSADYEGRLVSPEEMRMNYAQFGLDSPEAMDIWLAQGGYRETIIRLCNRVAKLEKEVAAMRREITMNYQGPIG